MILNIMDMGSGGPESASRRLCRPLKCWHILQGMLLSVILTAHIPWAASNRNVETRTVRNTYGPWNKTLQKSELRCSNYHRPDASSYFYKWPEDDPRFDHCCTFLDETINNEHHSYGIYGPVLMYARYYDVGLVDECLPYWKCGHLFQRLYETHLHLIWCEVTDLERLYSQRFWNGTVFKHGLLQSALPFILSLEIMVLAFVALDYCRYGWKRFLGWFQVIHKTFLLDWLHTCLLAIIGNGLTEAVAHASHYSSLSKSFYNYGQLYIGLSVLVWISSFLQQLCYWIAVNIEGHMELPEAAQNQAASQSTTEISGTTTGSLRILSASSMKRLEKRIGLTDDWKWQPIAAQAGILFCLWVYLTSTEAGDQAGVVFGIVVQAACPWSGLYTLKVIVHTLPFLVKQIYNSALKPANASTGATTHPPRDYAMFTALIANLKRWQGQRGSNRGQGGRIHAQPEDPIELLDLEKKV